MLVGAAAPLRPDTQGTELVTAGGQIQQKMAGRCPAILFRQCHRLFAEAQLGDGIGDFGESRQELLGILGIKELALRVRGTILQDALDGRIRHVEGHAEDLDFVRLVSAILAQICLTSVFDFAVSVPQCSG